MSSYIKVIDEAVIDNAKLRGKNMHVDMHANIIKQSPCSIVVRRRLEEPLRQLESMWENVEWDIRVTRLWT